MAEPRPSALQFLVRRFTIRTAHCDAGDIADRLNCGDKRHDAHQPDQTDRRRCGEFQTEMRVRQADPGGAADGVDFLAIDHAERNCNDVADDKAKEDRRCRPDAFAVAADHQDGKDDKQGKQPVRQVAKAASLTERRRVSAAACGILDADRQQRKPDGHNDDTRYQGGDPFAYLRDEIPENHLEQSANQRRAEDRCECRTAFERTGQNADIGKARALHDRQA